MEERVKSLEQEVAGMTPMNQPITRMNMPSSKYNPANENSSAAEIPATPAPHWFVESNGQSLGPYTVEQLIEFGQAGNITRESLVWLEGQSEWIAAGTVTGLFGETATSARAAVPRGPSPRPAGSPYDRTVLSAIRHHQTPPKATWANVLWSFEGRVSRRTYWGVTATWFAIWLACIAGFAASNFDPTITGWGTLLLGFLTAWSRLAILMKRWQDLGKSGAMAFIILIPVIGEFWTFVQCGCTRGTLGYNMYGPDPTYAPESASR